VASVAAAELVSAAESVAVGVAPSAADEDVSPPVPPAALPFADEIDNEHFRTSSTAGCPFASVIGVRVTSQVSVIGPAEL
jgi:hypothetical protein